MSPTFAITILTAAAIAATFASAALAADPRDSTSAGDKYGYTYRIESRDVHGDRVLAGMDRSGVSSDPARKFDVYTDGALAGMDRSGVSSDPARKFDVYTDGALAGMDRSGVSSDPARKFDVYTDGALASMDPRGGIGQARSTCASSCEASCCYVSGNTAPQRLDSIA